MDVSEKEDAPLYGCAIDIGTTTVTGVLMDLKTGTLTAKASAGNGQIRYGADVINRIVEQGKPGGTKRLQDAILKETLLPLVAAMCKSAGIPVSRVFRVCIASNTTMNHLLLGLNGLVVKTHGSSRAKEITNSIYQCVTFREENINEIIKERVADSKNNEEE